MFLNYLTLMCAETLMQDQCYIISGSLGSSVIYKQRFVTPDPQTPANFYSVVNEKLPEFHTLCVETQFMLKANTYVGKTGLNTPNWYRLNKDVPVKIVSALVSIKRNEDYLFAFANPDSFQINIDSGAKPRNNYLHEMLFQKVDINTFYQILNDEVNQRQMAQTLVFEPRGIHVLQRYSTDQPFSLSQPFELSHTETNLRNYRVASTQKYFLSLRALNAFISGANDGTEEFKVRFNFVSYNQIKLLSDVDAEPVDFEEILKIILNKSKKVFKRLCRWNAVVDKYLSNGMTKDEFLPFWNGNYNLLNVVIENHQKAVHDTKDLKEVMKFLLYVPYLLSVYGQQYLNEFRGLDGQQGKLIFTSEFFNKNLLEKWMAELKNANASDVRITNIFVVVLSEALNFVTNLIKNKKMFEMIFFINPEAVKINNMMKSIVETAIGYLDSIDESTQKKVQYFIEKAKTIFENNSTYLENKQPNEKEHAKLTKEITELNEEVQTHFKINEEKKIEKRKRLHQLKSVKNKLN